MAKPNRYYDNLEENLMFFKVLQKTNDFTHTNHEKHIYQMGIGDVTLPLCKASIEAMRKAVDEQANKETFHGYMLGSGAPFLRKAVASYYEKRNVKLSIDEIFITNGAGEDIGALVDIFDRDNKALIIDPTYPQYADTNIMDGRQIIKLCANKENGFLPIPDSNIKADMIYICSPNNPTGAVYNKQQLKQWVDFANKTGAIIIMDSAYEAFIEDPSLPHSIFEIEGAKTCAIEICSLSKTAGFTGMRCGYTVIPNELVRDGKNFNKLWRRNRTTKLNGVPYIIQRAAEAVFTDEGMSECMQNIGVYKNNARSIMQTLDKLGIWYCGGVNSPYIWMKCPNNMGSWEFFDYLLNEVQVVTIPGVGFGNEGDGYMRLSAFGDTDEIEKACERLYSLLKST